MNIILFYVGFSVVDDAFDKFPPVDKDSFWEDTIPEPLYTAQSAQRPMNPQVGSCVDMNTDEEPFMVRPRRRTISRMSHWDGDVDENDVVPVYGMQKLKDNSNYASGESLAFSQSFLNQSRKLSEMFKRMRGGRKNSEGISSMGSFYRHRRSRKQSRSEVNMESNQKQMSCNSSSSSIDQFGESFHNSVSPPPSLTKIPGTFHCNSAPDTLKSQKDDEGVKPPTSPTAGVSWFVDEMLPVIEEEENEKKRVSDEDSLRSSSVRSMGRTISASNDPLPTLHEKQGMEILSEHIDEQDTNTPREERQGDITNQTIL